MPRPAAAVQWKRSHGCRRVTTHQKVWPPAASRSYARPPRRDYRQRGRRLQRKPASESHSPTVPWQRNPTSSQEAKGMSEHRHFDFAITARKARKRNPTVATTSQIQALPTHPDGARNGQRPRKPGGPECNRRNASARNHPEAMEQRNPTRWQEAGAISRNTAMAMERCKASGHHQIHDNASKRLERPRRSGGHVSEIKEPKVPSSACYQYGRERNASSGQNAMANGAATASSYVPSRAHSP